MQESICILNKCVPSRTFIPCPWVKKQEIYSCRREHKCFKGCCFFRSCYRSICNPDSLSHTHTNFSATPIPCACLPRPRRAARLLDKAPLLLLSPPIGNRACRPACLSLSLAFAIHPHTITRGTGQAQRQEHQPKSKKTDDMQRVNDAYICIDKARRIVRRTKSPSISCPRTRLRSCQPPPVRLSVRLALGDYAVPIVSCG